MRKTALALFVFTAMCLSLNAQNTATFHVFPQVADGLTSDGTVYFSTLVGVNVGTKPATCTIHLYGSVATHIRGDLTMTIPASGGVAAKNTSITEAVILPLATGYGTLTCDQPVAAQVGYFYVTPVPLTFLGSATVFSSPPTTRAEVFVSNTTGFRSAVAIANDTDAQAVYQLSVISATGQQMSTVSVSVPARSNVPKFIDELVQLPANFTGGVIISSATTPFSAVGLLFNGSSFLSVAAVPFG